MSNEAFPAAAIQNPELLFQGQTLEENVMQGGEGLLPVQSPEGRTYGEAMQPEEVPENRLARLGSRVTELARDHMPNKWVAGATAAVLAVGSGAELASACADEPVTPPTNAPALTGKALKRACKKEIFKKPQLIPKQTGMLHPGKNNQAIYAGFDFNKVEGCSPRYWRGVAGKFQMQDRKHRHKWLNLSGPHWNRFAGGNQEGEGALMSTNSYHKKKLYYKPGSGARLRFKLRIQDKDTKKGKVVGKRVWKYPVKVEYK